MSNDEIKLNKLMMMMLAFSPELLSSNNKITVSLTTLHLATMRPALGSHRIPA